MNELLGHKPLDKESHDILEDVGLQLFNDKKYDVDMGRKMHDAMEQAGLDRVQSYILEDKELSFQGSAQSDVVLAWEARFDRLSYLHRLYGIEKAKQVKQAFIKCITSPKHLCSTQVVMTIGRLG